LREDLETRFYSERKKNLDSREVEKCEIKYNVVTPDAI
jgi:hypothetical protein